MSTSAIDEINSISTKVSGKGPSEDFRRDCFAAAVAALANEGVTEPESDLLQQRALLVAQQELKKYVSQPRVMAPA